MASSPSLLPARLAGIHKRFGRNVVLRGVELSVGRGEIVGLMGANGSGKTTLFTILVGLEQPDDGAREFAGEVVEDVDVALRCRLAYVAHASQLYPLLTARENLELFADLRRAAGAESLPAAEVLERIGLAEAIDRPVRTFSRGMVQRVVLARALAASPELLVLDEPFTALDPGGRDELASLLRAERDRGVGILLSSHDLDTLASVADRVLLLADGVIADEVRADAVADAPAMRAALAGLGRWK